VIVFINFEPFDTRKLILAYITGAETATRTSSCRARDTFWIKVCNKEASVSEQQCQHHIRDTNRP